MEKRFNIARLLMLFILFILVSSIIPLVSAVSVVQFNATFDDDSDLVSGYTCTVSGGNLRCINGQFAQISHKLINNSETKHNSTIELRAKFTTLRNNEEAWFYKDDKTTSTTLKVWGINGKGGNNIIITNDNGNELTIGTVDDTFHTWKFVNLIDSSVDIIVDNVYKGNIAYSSSTGNGTNWLFKCTNSCDFTVDWITHYDERCSDGTQSGLCSATKPFYCDKGTLTNNCGFCGCDANYGCELNGECKLLTCSDGTLYNQCSPTKPKYCSNGVLVDNCATCGCNTNYACQAGGACQLKTCSDGTPYNQCSATKPQYCGDGTLTNNCGVCGCNVGQVCLANGNCFTPPKITSGINYSGSTNSSEDITFWCSATDKDQSTSTLTVKAWIGTCDPLNCFNTRDWSTGLNGVPMQYDSTTGQFKLDWTLPWSAGTTVAGTCQAYDNKNLESNWGDKYPFFTVTERILTCSDGTLYGQCSATKPLYCSDGTLTNNCGICGCPVGQACQAGLCKTPTCSDGTPKNTCSTTKPKYCNNNLQLVNNCEVCGCSSGQSCSSTGTCVGSPKSTIELNDLPSTITKNVAILLSSTFSSRESFVGNTVLNELSDGTTEKNLEFGGAGNQTVYLKLKKDSTVTTARFILDGDKNTDFSKYYKLSDNEIEYTKLYLYEDFESFLVNEIESWISMSTGEIGHRWRDDIPNGEIVEYWMNGTINLTFSINYNNQPNIMLSTAVAGHNYFSYNWDSTQQTIQIYNHSSSSWKILYNKITDNFPTTYVVGDYICKVRKFPISISNDYVSNGKIKISYYFEAFDDNPQRAGHRTDKSFFCDDELVDLGKGSWWTNGFEWFRLYYSLFPSNISIDVGSNSIKDWSYEGELNSPITTPDLSSKINEYLDTCSIDSQGNCIVPLTFYSASAGLIKISNIDIRYQGNNSCKVCISSDGTCDTEWTTSAVTTAYSSDYLSSTCSYLWNTPNYDDGIYNVGFRIKDIANNIYLLSKQVTLASCSDGTQNNQCSTTKPLYCSDGTLTNNCRACGCSSGESCSSTGACVNETTTIPADATLKGADGSWCIHPSGNRGTTKYFSKEYCQDNTGNYTDFCDGGTVRSYNCGGTWDGSKWTNVKCSAGGYVCTSAELTCSDGACVKVLKFPIVTYLGDIDGDGFSDTITNTGINVGSTGGMNISNNIIALQTLEGTSSGGGIDQDLNNDGDKNDYILRYYDIRTGTITNTKIDIGRLGEFDISGNVIAMKTFEGSGSSYASGIDQDLNNDGDKDDYILRYYDISTGTVTNTEINLGRLGGFDISGNIIALKTSEKSNGGIDQDLNNDGDKDDYILRYYDISTGTVTNTEISLGSPGRLGISGNVIAMKTYEGSSTTWPFGIDQDLNNDGDKNDLILRYYDISTGTVTNTEIEIGQFGGFGISNNIIAMKTFEGSSTTWPYGPYGIDQDLNNDGDKDDFILRYYDIRTGTVTNTEINLGRFGGFDISGNVIALKTFEASSTTWPYGIDQDLNNDGDKDDVILRYVTLSKYGSISSPSYLSNNDNISFEHPSYGKIRFFDTIDITGVPSINDYIKIAYNRVDIYSDILPALNKTATIYLYNLTYSNPKIVRDGQVCPSTICTIISYVDGNLVFTVTHPSSYTVEEAPRIWNNALTRILIFVVVASGLIYYYIKKEK